ncbi:hypothetical protein B9N43_10825 [Denitratisoma sp. DHT3]|uniref:PilN domain-containing protein n=1 Tax=Denitratisoma sp. DHT3 TaxID=1981880 RepID=UPI001198CA59|nr:PilN domain-containing protein [Denitratisoma sp. DHT3]QDX81703.1 hypothetical protein B9N43_10825 [Denitratisoma sp. DHT3]
MSQQINLYNPGLLKKREWLTAANVAMGAASLLVLVALWGGWARFQADRLEREAAPVDAQLKAMQQQLTALSKEMSERKPSPKLEQELKTAQNALLARQTVAGILERGLGKQAVGFAEYLRGLARQTPTGVWLTGFVVAADGSGMEIRGRTTDPALLPDYILRLNDEKVFRGRAFAALQMQEGSLAEKSQSASIPAGTAAPLKAAAGFHEFALVPSQPGPDAAGGEGVPSRSAIASGHSEARKL